jgi:hypothetical protein
MAAVHKSTRTGSRAEEAFSSPNFKSGNSTNSLDRMDEDEDEGEEGKIEKMGAIGEVGRMKAKLRELEVRKKELVASQVKVEENIQILRNALQLGEV